jgi:acyl-CoA thioester hydrolase
MARLHSYIQLRWSDFDAYAHVNNAEMFRIFEEARISTFWRSDDGTSAHGAAVLDARPGASHVALIARQEAEYVRPIPYMRQPIDVEVWIGHLGGASLEVDYEVYSPAGVEPRVLYTRASTTLVMVELATGSPVRINDEQRTAWAPYVEEPVQFTKRG